MADLKQEFINALKPFARKVGSDIKNIEYRVFTSKAINVVDFGIDNTGATDVTVKLNELFKKVYNEDYNEVIFPDGTYKISGAVKVSIPSDHKKYVYIHAQNRYKSKIEMYGIREPEGSHDHVGFQLQPESFESTTTSGYNVHFAGFVIEGHELPADENNQSPSNSIYAIYTTQEYHETLNMTEYKLYNFACTNMDFFNTYYSISISCGIFGAEIKNIYIERAECPLDIISNYSNNNSLDTITVKNCKNGISVSAKCSAKNIDIINDDESIFTDSSMPNHILCPYLLSNVYIKGFYNLSMNSNVFSINAQGTTTISDIRLDLKPTGTDNIYRYDNEVPSFIGVFQSNSEPKLITVSDVTFEKFEENFADVFEKVPKFAYFNNNIAISLHNITKSDHLKFFKEKAVNVIYEKAGSYNKSYNIKNEFFKQRPFLGTDRSMNDTIMPMNSNFGALYLASSKDTPLIDNKGEDYSENTAAIRGDIFTEVYPEKNGHFAYVSTYDNVDDISLDKSEIVSLTYNEDDKLYTITFNEMPVWATGTLKGRVPNVGSVVFDEYNSISFEIMEVDESTKSFKLKPDIESKEGLQHPYKFSQGDDHQEDDILFYSNKIMPRKINRMKNMTYVTVPIIHSGNTENRPTEHLVVGQMYFDTTVGAPVFWNGTEWIQGNNGGSVDTSSFATKADISNAIAAIPAATPVDTSNLVTKQELESALNVINEKLKQIHGDN